MPHLCKAFQEEITNAMAAMLGCGGPAGEAKIASTQAALRPMWVELVVLPEHCVILELSICTKDVVIDDANNHCMIISCNTTGP